MSHIGTHFADARAAVERGEPGQSIRYQMTLSAGTVVAIDERVPDGMRIQDATLMLLALALVEQP